MTETASPRSGADERVTAALTQFLFHEAAALDERRYDDWFSLLDDEFEYRAPVVSSREDPELSPYSETSVLAWESKSSLRYRFDRYKSEFAWADRPPAHVRHFVSNVRIDSPVAPQSWQVRSNVLIWRERLPERTTLVSASRVDLIREHPDDVGFRLVRRTVLLDVEAPTASQLSVLF